MNKLIAILLIFLIFGCKNISNNNKAELTEKPELTEKSPEQTEKWDFKHYLTKEIQYPLEKMNRKSISELDTGTLRVWRFPGGGAAFEQMLEFKESNSELTFHSYVDEKYETEIELAELNFSETIVDKGIKEKLKAIISDPNFINTEDSEKYCEPSWSCSDVYFIQYTNGKEIGQFVVNHNIEGCDNNNVENSKNIFKIMNKVVKKYSR
ncbi:hypothetical protein JBL43_00755 [Aureibaculum sp. A20]|uniref:Lipoprotein n=1 Tax=Aureibaculum flavum TaxID=2795986 RepID=A0ABS0WLA0_9FLAO|nr:hypothetical protein [Aureibaculum flavum]MBJ2172745.1 hypothetical protein [Aureibaculum flavum]